MSQKYLETHLANSLHLFSHHFPQAMAETKQLSLETLLNQHLAFQTATLTAEGAGDGAGIEDTVRMNKVMGTLVTFLKFLVLLDFFIMISQCIKFTY